MNDITSCARRVLHYRRTQLPKAGLRTAALSDFPIATLLPGSFARIASGAGIAVASKAAQASLDRDQPLTWTGTSSARLYQTRRTVPLT
jgi:hypothetical protein